MSRNSLANGNNDNKESSNADPEGEKCTYLDYNGTTPVHPRVLEAMMPYFTTHFGNPSSSHHYGREPKAAIGRARRSLLKLLQASSTSSLVDGKEGMSVDEASCVLFTGCGTECNNLAIRLALLSVAHSADARGAEPIHVVTSNVEHPAVSQCLAAYASGGGLAPLIEVTEVCVDSEGRVSASDVADAIRPNTALVTIMAANNESGSVQPVFEISRTCRARGVLFHTDAAQAAGKIDLRGLADPESGCDMLTLVGHKFGAPKGIAALYIRPGCLSERGRVEPDGSVLLTGGGQEFGRRGGTENVPYMVGMGRAAELLFERGEAERILSPGMKPETNGVKIKEGVEEQADELVVEQWEANATHMEQMRNRLLQNLQNGLDDRTYCEDDDTEVANGNAVVRPNGPFDPKNRLPNTLSVGLRGVRSGELLQNIGHVVACSAGSACHSSSSSCGGSLSYSSILKAMKVPPEYAIGTLRLTVGPDTSLEDVDRAATIIVNEARIQLGQK